MLDEICGHIHNYFADAEDIRAGHFVVENGGMELPFLKEGQYFRVTGSTFNDGVFRYPAQDMTDEAFDGTIWPMKPPRAFLSLCEEIVAWQEKYGAAMASPFSGESIIGVYSYTRAAGSDGGGASGAAWAQAFKSRLNRWRKLS
jgi:hypothetical protein